MTHRALLRKRIIKGTLIGKASAPAKQFNHVTVHIMSNSGMFNLSCFFIITSLRSNIMTSSSEARVFISLLINDSGNKDQRGFLC